MMNAHEKAQLKKMKERLESGKIADQRIWSFIKELNSFSEERLDTVAIRDGYRTYTYRQMFRNWEHYAEVFSALNITEKNHSRAMLVGTMLTESIFAMYGLNMTGASVSLLFHFDLYDDENIRNMIVKENVTDLIVSELFAFPNVMKKLLRDKEKLGLRNIIVLESPMGGEYAIPPLEVARKLNTSMFREFSGGLVMKDLLKEYEAYPISYGSKASADASVILHTTGTVSGIHKPVPMSDEAINSFVRIAYKAKDTYEDFQDAPDHIVSCLMLNMSWAYATVDMLHTTLGLGGEVVCLPYGATNPRYSEAIEEYGVNVFFTSRTILDSWGKSMPDMDLSKVKLVFMGGSYVSPEFKETFNNYLKSCGSTARVINGYGLSELGGACLIAGSDRKDDAIGYPMPYVKVKIFSEEENRFYDVSDGERTGVLFVSSPAMSNGLMDDLVCFVLEEVDGDMYYNSNDLVRVNKDGSLTCIGRSNKYFVNNEGVRFDAGLIETAVTAQPGIVACGLTPEFQKFIHDNVPVLYVQTSGGKADELVIVRNALIQVFLVDGKLADTNLPSQCVLTDSMPLNAGGKVDAKKLASGAVKGRRYHVKPVKMNGKVTDIILVPASEGENATQGAGVPEELENDPYNIVSELFAAIPEILDGRYERVFKIPGLREMFLKLMDFDIDNIPGSIYKLTPQLIKLTMDEYPMNLFKGGNMMGGKMGLDGFTPMFQGMMSMVQGTMPMPPMPFLPFGNAWSWPGQMNDANSKSMDDWESFKSNMDAFWGQMRNMHKASMESAKGQWNAFFDQCMEMEESFADSLPDEMPFFTPVSPKEYLKKEREFREMANKQAMEQADSFFDYAEKRREYVGDIVSEGVKNTTAKMREKKKNIDGNTRGVKAESKKEEAPAKKASAKKTSAKKTSAKKSPAKKAAPRKTKKTDAQ